MIPTPRNGVGVQKQIFKAPSLFTAEDSQVMGRILLLLSSFKYHWLPKVFDGVAIQLISMV